MRITDCRDFWRNISTLCAASDAEGVRAAVAQHKSELAPLLAARQRGVAVSPGMEQHLSSFEDIASELPPLNEIMRLVTQALLIIDPPMAPLLFWSAMELHASNIRKQIVEMDWAVKGQKEAAKRTVRPHPSEGADFWIEHLDRLHRFIGVVGDLSRQTEEFDRSLKGTVSDLRALLPDQGPFLMSPE